MSTIGHFVYFINYVKDSLSFRDAEDFTEKIRNDFDFRLKVQKFVYIAKYFGWKHSYKYSLYIRGPYSSTLADEYYNEEDPFTTVCYGSAIVYEQLSDK